MKKIEKVFFKGKKDGITVNLDSEAAFIEIKTALLEKTIEMRDFFGKARTRISFQGRELNEAEENELLKIIMDNSDLTFFYADAESGTQPKRTNTPPPKERAATSRTIKETEDKTIYHKGSVRSGRCLRVAGSIVIYGDINSGAEVIADGSIIVLGALKGLAHAGYPGDLNATISALSLYPTQIRIADSITYIPEDALSKKKKALNPVFIFADEKGRIFIEPLIK